MINMISNLPPVTVLFIIFGICTFLRSIYNIICWSMTDDSKQKDKEYKNNCFFTFWVSLVFSAISFFFAIYSYYRRE